jgi:HAD superfamily hydrolase (TIGR01490 family)
VRRQLALAGDESERFRRGRLMAAPADTAPAPAPRRVVAAFDFDGTVTDRDTLVPFLVLAFGRRRVAAGFAALAFTGLGYLLRRVTIDEFKRRVLRRLAAGQPAGRVRALGPAHARAVTPWLRPDALQRIEWHRARGHVLVLVSSTLDLYLVPVAAQLGFDHLLCSRLEVHGGGEDVERFTGRLEGSDCTGAEKLRRLAALLGGLGAVELHVYGDSEGDRELLAAADHPHYRAFRRSKPGVPSR